MSFYFAIIGTKDNPLYVYEFGTSKSGGDGFSHFPESLKPLPSFILHSSLDLLEELQWSNRDLYLKTVDRFNNLLVSGFVTAGNIKFLLLSDQKGNEEAIKQFFMEVWEAYVKCLMNPFYEVDMRIGSWGFGRKVEAAGRKYL